MSHPSSSVERDPIDRLAESFLTRFRAGERPSIEEYAAKYPELADEIRELLPALVELEQNLAPEGAATRSHDNPGDPDSDPGTAPRQIGDYLIVREVGRGGMGVVYEAVQQSLGRHVALKLLPAGSRGNRTQIERFRLEARAAARLHHTNIVPVFGVGEEDGVYYYAMQFIQGQSLDAIVDEMRHLKQRFPAAGALVPSDESRAALTRTVTEGLVKGRFAPMSPGETTNSGAAPLALEPSEASSRDANGATECEAVLTGAPKEKTTASAATSSNAGTCSELSSMGGQAAYFRSVAHVGLQVAEALEYAHDQGILHRDIKPSNLMVDAKGTVWVTDFGLAKTEGIDGMTGTGDVVGTLRYMAPERLDGWSDRRSDVYGLGATLYELVTLRPPFDASNRARLIEKVLHDHPSPPHKLDSRIPRDLETVVLKAMARDAGSRYVSAQQMAEDLRRFLADRPVLARRTTVAERLARWCKRNKAIASLAALLGLVLAGGTIVSTVAAFRFRELAHSEGDAKTQASRSADAAKTKAEELEWQLYSSRIGQAHREWQANNLSRTRELLDACPPRLRGWEWRFVRRLCHLERFTYRGHRETPWCVAYSPDGRLVASGGGQYRSTTEPGHGELLIWDAVTGRERTVLRGLHYGVTGVAFSPDGRLLAAVGTLKGSDQNREGELMVMEVATGKRAFVRRVVGDGLACVAFSPDGQLLAAGCGVFGNVASSQARSCVLWNARSGQEVVSLPGANTVMGLAFSPDGRRLALSRFGGVELRDLADHRIVRAFSGRPYYGYQVTFTNDGRKLISGGDPPHTLVWDVETGAVIQTLEAFGTMGLTLSPDGTRLVTGGWGEEIRLWDTSTWTKIGELRGHEGPMSGASFRVDGQDLATARFDGSVKLWDPRMDAPRKFRITDVRPTEEAWVTGVALSHDGGRLYISSRDNTVRAWDVERAAPLWTIDGPNGEKSWEDRIWSVALSPDGRELAAGHNLGTVLRCDAETGRQRPALRAPNATGIVLGVAYSPDGRLIASTHADKTLCLWHAATGSLRRSWIAHPNSIRSVCVAFSPDSTLLASGGGDYEWQDAPGSLAMWETATGRRLYAHEKLPSSVRAVAFHPNGTTLAAVLGTRHLAQVVQLLDARTGRVMESFPAHNGNTTTRSLAFSPDGTRLAIGGRSLKLWDVASRRDVVSLHASVLEVGPLTFSRDGHRIAAGCFNATALVWDATPLELPGSPAGDSATATTIDDSSSNKAAVK